MNVKIFSLVGTIAVLVAIITYLAFSTPSVQNTGNLDTTEENDYLKLSSLTLWTDHNELIGEIESNMKLKKGQPVFLRANFSNPNKNVGDYIIIVQVWNSESQTVVQSQVWGKAVGSGDIRVDTFWQPSDTGTYEVIIYVFKPSDLSRTDTHVRLPALASVPIIVE